MPLNVENAIVNRKSSAVIYIYIYIYIGYTPSDALYHVKSGLGVNVNQGHWNLEIVPMSRADTSYKFGVPILEFYTNFVSI